MTQMHSPYETPPDVMLYQEPERTSIMAILSMVFGIGGCCLGLTSIPAIFLGIFSLIGISKSKGRIGGAGFSIVGILVGVLTLALWSGALGAVTFAYKSFERVYSTGTEQILLDLQANNFDAVRASLAPPAADVSDEELIAFREGYRSGLGNLVSKTDGFGDVLKGYLAVGEQIQPYNGKFGYTPVPMVFDSGYGLVLYVIDPLNIQKSSTGDPMAIKLIVIDSQGNEYHLPMETQEQTQEETQKETDRAADTGDADDVGRGDDSADDDSGGP